VSRKYLANNMKQWKAFQLQRINIFFIATRYTEMIQVHLNYTKINYLKIKETMNDY